MESNKKVFDRWMYDEVQALLCIYAEDEIQRDLESTVRNDRVYAKIAARLAKLNINHTPKQVREKLKKMKQDYKRIKDHNNQSDAARRTSKWYDQLDSLLGHRSSFSRTEATKDSAAVLFESTHREDNAEFNDTGGDLVATMNPRLTSSQQTTICSQLGFAKLQLLFKATVHGFTSSAFHQRCDNLSPTVSVGYNAAGYVFGGYTRRPFNTSGQNVRDEEAFLFTFSGENLIKYPVTRPDGAVTMATDYGPSFGDSLVLIIGNYAQVLSNQGNYNYDTEEMHGNDFTLTECEVYQVIELPVLEKPWRSLVWENERRTDLMESIMSYKPLLSSVSQVRVLLVGPVGAGKSSFFNSVNSVFRGHVTSQAMAGSTITSLTTQFRTYIVKSGREGTALPIVLCDTMGLEENAGMGLCVDDISNILKGHVPDRYQFNPSAPLSSESDHFCKSPDLKDKIHCVAYVIDACKVSIMPPKLVEKLDAIRRKVNVIGIPQLVLMTKVDEACPIVSLDIQKVYQSSYIKELMQETSTRLGLPLSCIVPVKNYSEELELDPSCDILLLSAVNQMLRFADNHFDDISDQVNNIEVKT